LPGDVARSLRVLRTVVGTLNPSGDTPPRLRLNNVIQPQATLLVIPVGVTDPLLVQRDAGLVHPAVQRVVRSLRLAVEPPNVLRRLVVDGVGVIDGAALQPGVPPQTLVHPLPHSGDGPRPVQRFWGADTHQREAQLPLGVPVSEGGREVL